MGVMKVYCVIIGDIVNSREILNRNEVQIKFKTILHNINSNYSDYIVSNFSITLGDEFQGVLNRISCFYDIVETIKIEMYPIKFRFGVGVGDINTDIERLSPFGADGPAYYKSRDLLNHMKEQKNKKMASKSSIMIKSGGFEDDVINAVLALNCHIQDGWAEKQREYIRYYLMTEESQRDIAEHFNVLQGTVQKALNSSGFYEYLNAKKLLIDYLKNRFGECNDYR